MAIKLEENIHQIHDWHRVSECMPLLETLMRTMENEIDDRMIAVDPMDPDYVTFAATAWIERRAIEGFRKALTKVVKRGKTASKVIAPVM